MSLRPFAIALIALAFSTPLHAADAPAPGPDATVVERAAQLPVDAFFQLDAFDMIKIAPDGAHIAATVPMEGRMMLVFLRLSDMKQTGGLTLEGDSEVNDFFWVNAHQVVYTVHDKNGSLARPSANRFLYIANADGSESRVLNSTAPMFLIDSLRDDDDHILVGPGIRKVKLSNGHNVENMMRGYGPSHEGWVYPDNTGIGRIDIGTIGNERRNRLYARIGDTGGHGDDWSLINDGNVSGVETGMLGFSADNRTAYVQFQELDGPDAVYALDMATGERELVYRHSRVDPFSVLESPVTGGVVALVHLDGKPVLHIVDAQDRHAKELQKMGRAFPDSFVYPTSFTRDGDKAIYLVSSDVNSGEFYLVDHANGRADYLAERQKAMLPDLMSPMRPFRFHARDGVELEGFLTMPRDAAAGRPVPLVVIPHGGPLGIFDTWGFDPEVQLLASRGYGVLQVNFRGSGNYGLAFTRLGNGQWGKGMIDDVVDATKWAIAEGVATAGRICMYGASYGAYAAMVASANEPSLYACAIGNVGVYDIRRMYSEDTFRNMHAQRFFNDLFGARPNLEAISPTRFADRIRVPVLLGAGEVDRIAPPDQTDAMLDALRDAGTPVEHVEYENEAHGNYLVKNKVDWARRVLALLDRTIGAGAAPPAASDPAPADAGPAAP